MKKKTLKRHKNFRGINSQKAAVIKLCTYQSSTAHSAQKGNPKYNGVQKSENAGENAPCFNAFIKN